MVAEIQHKNIVPIPAVAAAKRLRQQKNVVGAKTTFPNQPPKTPITMDAVHQSHPGMCHFIISSYEIIVSRAEAVD
jgi:hypothetical protein